MGTDGAKLDAEIKRWIESAESPKDKALLLILFQINGSLTENTNATKAISVDFHDHRSRVERVMNRMSGGWWVFLFFIALVQVLVGYIVNQNFAALAKESDRNDKHEHRLTVVEGVALSHDRLILDMLGRIKLLEQNR